MSSDSPGDSPGSAPGSIPGRAAAERVGPGAAAVVVRGLEKTYRIYARPQDRLKQSLWRGRRSFHREVRALRNLSFEVGAGETFGIVGRNGCGKSTLLQIIAGTLTPSGGEIVARERVTGLLELGAGFNPEFSGLENVRMGAALMGLDGAQTRERLERITGFADIGDFVTQPVKTYSSGMAMRLAFATAIHADPEILVIDEALAVGDEAFQRKCFNKLAELKQAGVTILFVSHSAPVVVELCDRAMLLDEGERLLVGEPREVVHQYHKLLYAPLHRVEAIRRELRAIDRGEARAEAEADPQAPRPHFDAELVPESTFRYAERGARVDHVRIVDAGGTPTNLLAAGASYRIEYEVEFTAACERVRLGTVITSLTGVELCGMQSHPEGDCYERIEAGRRFHVRFHFENRFLPGTFFVRAGLTGFVDGEEVFLHRIIDACMFRVLPEERLPMTGLVDVATAPRFEIEPVP